MSSESQLTGMMEKQADIIHNDNGLMLQCSQPAPAVCPQSHCVC